MKPFTFDRVKAERSITDPDGALWPVNAYSDADELNNLVDDALTSEAIAREDPGAFFAIYPMSLSEPDPQVAVSLGPGPALLGNPLKLREQDGEGPVDFTLRLLDELTAEANELATGPSSSPACEAPTNLNLRCRDCCSEEAALTDRGTRMECGNCGAFFHREQALVTIGEVEEGQAPDAEASESGSVTVSPQHLDARTGWPAEVRVDRPEQLDELVRLAANAEIGLTVYEEAPCTCSPSRGCPQCFDRADALVGATVRDGDGCEWEVAEAGEEDCFPSVNGGPGARYSARPSDVEVLHEPA